MTAAPASSPAIFVVAGASHRGSDPVRTGVAGRDSFVNAAARYASHEDDHQAAARRGLRSMSETRGTGPRGPHPGDVLYWVACLGGACLLLLSATT
jgi:hypothetical protein